MKTRILQQGPIFYVQYKRLFFWHDVMNYWGSDPARFPNLEQARDRAKRIEQELLEEEKPTIIHNTNENGR